jgi:hypothetical protein
LQPTYAPLAVQPILFLRIGGYLGQSTAVPFHQAMFNDEGMTR